MQLSLLFSALLAAATAVVASFASMLLGDRYAVVIEVSGGEVSLQEIRRVFGTAIGDALIVWILPVITTQMIILIVSVYYYEPRLRHQIAQSIVLTDPKHVLELRHILEKSSVNDSPHLLGAG